MLPKLCVLFTVSFLLNRTADSIDVDKQDSTYLTNISFGHKNLRRYIRQNNNQCLIPNNPPHTKYNIIVGQIETKYGSNDYAQNNNVLEITCDDEYKLNPFTNNFTICRNGIWFPPLSNCLRTCPSLTSVRSTNVTCKWNNPDGTTIHLQNCINPVEGTVVFLSCNSFYEDSYIKKNPVRVCMNGNWDPAISICYPICGLKRPEAQTNIVNGINTTPGDYPWQVGVYDEKKQLICGGSILDYRVILSAAHCFSDFDGNVKSNENYFITAGKYYRDYEDSRDKFAQYSNVLKIHTPSRYKGIVNFQGFDIAIIILTDPFKISLRVQPVCIELNEESQDLHLSRKTTGIVTGWGYTQNGKELSEVLKEIEIPYIPYDECYAAVPYTFRRYITHDKICGGYINNGTSVCGGDSGGGLVFMKMNSDQYYVKGIVSVSPATEEGVCDSNQYSVYTAVAQHIDFVRKHFLYNQIRQKLECSQNDCANETPANITNINCRNNYKNVKENCTLPNFPPNGKYILNQNDTYKSGGFVPLNSLLWLTCNTGFRLTVADANKAYCIDTGEWTPSLTTCTRVITTCITPNNETAICKPISECEVIKTALRSGTNEAISFVLKSQCGNTSESLACCGTSGFPSLILQHPLLPGPDECGTQAIDDNDIEGRAQVKEFPWLVMIIQTDEKSSVQHFGRGALINSRYVLTSAYLLRRYQSTLILNGVRIGVHDFSKQDLCGGESNCVSLGIESFVVHPSYNWDSRIADISLLRLNRTVEFNEYIRPICLPTSTYPVPFATDLWLTGWGSNESDKELQVKFKGKVSVISTIECNLYRIGFNRTFCAVRSVSVTKKRLCLGDLAGPAVRRIYNMYKNQWYWVQEGITSFTYIVCNSTHYRGLYTNISEYTEWIISNIS